jgi:hypothetical protein
MSDTTNCLPFDLSGEGPLQAALVVMYGFHRAAEINGRTAEDLAVDRAFLWKRGVKNAQVHALIDGGYIEPRAALSRPRRQPTAAPVCSRPARDLRTRFVLTTAGIALVWPLVPVTGNGAAGSAAGPGGKGPLRGKTQKPEWVASARELRYGGCVVKRFRRVAPIQKLILETFQELGWPESIDNPLPRDRHVKVKDRLREAVKSLNRRRINPVMQFHVDVSESRVHWTLKEAR